MIKSLIQLAVFTACVSSQSVNFGGGGGATTSAPADDDINTRGGLLADHIGQHPTGENGPGGRQTIGDHCCCVSINQNCPIPSNGGGGGSIIDVIDPRLKDPNANAGLRSAPTKRQAADDDFGIGVRIVNNPPNDQLSRSCPSGTRSCCYNTQSQLGSVGSFCRSYPGGSNTNERFVQGCSEGRNVGTGAYTGNQCGERFPRLDVPVGKAEARPYEFPWTCLVLKENNDFVGTCAIVPDNRRNDISRGTDRVITAAHKLKSVQGPDLLKVRIIEYDASGESPKEYEKHREFVVQTIRVHPNYNSGRLNHDVAILFLQQRIILNDSQHVNAACLPQCSNMFSHKYSNGTGVRCWVAGWGKDSPTGNFNFIQNKVDVPLVDYNTCNSVMKEEMRARGRSNFQLSRSEVCAGGETEKDACDGDGGAPLVCQAQTGRWYVVGLVTWGVGCGKSGVPGIYANVHNMLDFIVSPAPRRT